MGVLTEAIQWVAVNCVADLALTKIPSADVDTSATGSTARKVGVGTFVYVFKMKFGKSLSMTNHG